MVNQFSFEICIQVIQSKQEEDNWWQHWNNYRILCTWSSTFYKLANNTPKRVQVNPSLHFIYGQPLNLHHIPDLRRSSHCSLKLKPKENKIKIRINLKSMIRARKKKIRSSIKNVLCSKNRPRSPTRELRASRNLVCTMQLRCPGSPFVLHCLFC